jgi:amino-acid N-acetyltransferase
MKLIYYPVNSDDELAGLKSFLRENALPADDIQLDGNEFAVYRNAAGRIVGSGGLEFYGNFCLLRSVAVSSEFRKQGHGEAITSDLINRAKEKSVTSVYLLTETAEKFFEKFGFRKQAREDAPKEIQGSSEFSSVCPLSACLMSLIQISRSSP